MKPEEAIEIGFKPKNHFTVMNVHTYDAGRGRILAFGNIGTPNEIIFLQQYKANGKQFTDSVCVHNYDYDGYITKKRLRNLISSITGKELTKQSK